MRVLTRRLAIFGVWSLVLASCATRIPGPTPPPPAPTSPNPGRVTAFSATDEAAASFMTVHYFDVGQGNAAMLEFACGAVLIDAGGEDASTTARLLTHLETFFARRSDLKRTINSLFISHTHVDHTRAVREVLENFRVERLIENGQRPKSPAEASEDLKWAESKASSLKLQRLIVHDSDVERVAAKTGLTNATIDPVNCGSGGNPTIRVLASDLKTNPGWAEKEFANENNHSVVVRVDLGQSSFLFTGDMEEPALEMMVDYYRGTATLDVDVWQPSHHGSYNGTTESLLEAATPAYAVISVGPSTARKGYTAYSHGHPRMPAIEMLMAAISTQRPTKTVDVFTGQYKPKALQMRDAIYATGWDGTVSVKATASGTMSVSTEK